MSEIKYKGIDLKKIKQVQKVKLPHVHVDSEEVKLSLNYILSNNNMTAVQMELQDRTEALQRKYIEDHDMSIICEMAKLFLEEKEKQKRVLERLEEEAKKRRNRAYDLPDAEVNLFANYLLGMASSLEEAIEIIKEEVG